MIFRKRFFLIPLIIAAILLSKGSQTGVGGRITNAADNSPKSAVMENYTAVGQVRNNKIDLNQYNISAILWNDPVYEAFSDTGKTYREYKDQLFSEAKEMEIDIAKLKRTLKAAESMISSKLITYPVIIDTASYQNKDCFIFVFTWEHDGSTTINDTVHPLGHILIVAIEISSETIISYTSCL